MIRAAFIWDHLNLMPAAVDYFEHLTSDKLRVLSNGNGFDKKRGYELIVISLTGESREGSQKILDDVAEYAKKHSTFVAVWFLGDDLKLQEIENIHYMDKPGMTAWESLQAFDWECLDAFLQG